MKPPSPVFLLLSICVSRVLTLDFVVAGGQIFTPGFAVLDAPQPGTPLGGGKFHLAPSSRARPPPRLSPSLTRPRLICIGPDTIEVALDVSANGRLSLPPYAEDSPSRIHNITIFLYSYETGRNFTVTNGTAAADGASLGDIMSSEPGSTVKHVKWTWPDCLVGDGRPETSDSDRGAYNVRIFLLFPSLSLLFPL